MVAYILKSLKQKLKKEKNEILLKGKRKKIHAQVYLSLTSLGATLNRKQLAPLGSIFFL